MGSRMPVATTTASSPIRTYFSTSRSVRARWSTHLEEMGNARDNEHKNDQQKDDAGRASPTRRLVATAEETGTLVPGEDTRKASARLDDRGCIC